MDLSVPDEAGTPCLILSLGPLGGGAWAVRHGWEDGAVGIPDATAWGDALAALFWEAVARGARSVHARVVAGPVEGMPSAGRSSQRWPEAARVERQRAVLQALGFERTGARVELRRLLSALDGWVDARAATDPLGWESLAPDGPVTVARAVALMTRAAVGDPAWRPEDDAAELLEASLADPTLSNAGDCVQVGVASGADGPEDVAFVMAQVRPATGWSRVTWMGVVPEHRRRGYGAWVNARGLAMLRAQGGVHYLGGTDALNEPIRALFQAVATAGLDEVEEWERTVG